MLQSSYKDNKQPSHYANETTQNESKTVLADDRIADYTFWLVVFTGVLAIVSIGQGYFLFRADKRTQEQIRLGREEFIASHRPRIRIRYITCSPLKVGSPAVATIHAANVGDSAATITNLGADVFVRKAGLFGAASFNATPKPWTNNTFRIVPAGKEIVFDVSGGALTAPNVINIPSGAEQLCLIAMIIYADNIGIERNTSVARILHRTSNKFRFLPAGDEYEEWEYED